MQPTPATEGANVDLLALIPPRASRVVEAGCSVGALAREYRAANPDSEYIGIELEPVFAELARRHCSRVVEADVERMSDADFDALSPADCWVLGDVLEHLIDPWRFLARLPPRLHAGGLRRRLHPQHAAFERRRAPRDRQALLRGPGVCSIARTCAGSRGRR